MPLLRSSDGKLLADPLWRADRFLSRLRGLIGRDDFSTHGALWLRPCRSVHTFGMGFPIDVVFIDLQHRIIALKADVPAGRLCLAPRQCCSVIELHAGRSEQLDLQPGDRMEVG